MKNAGITIAAEVLQQWKSILLQTLPHYMVPDDIVVLKQFPLTPNLKIDRNALPRPNKKQLGAKEHQTAPLTGYEEIVANIWKETLGLEYINTTDDFFQLGGHSLLAVKVMVAIEKKTGKRLPIATLFNHSTVASLALQLTDKTTAEKWAALVPIKKGDGKMPLFLIHGAGLNILLFKDISDHFDSGQPLYGIQALGLATDATVPETMEQIAATYIDEILKVQPEGPYALAGYSMGGFLAFEMARQLQQMGKSLKMVGLIDTYAGNNDFSGTAVERTARKIARQFQKVPFYTRSFITNPKESLEYQVLAAQRRIKKLQTTEAIVPQEFTEHEAEIYKKYSDALDAYSLQPAELEVTLFRVAKRLYFLDDLTYLGWGKFAQRGVRVHEVPGDHKTFLFPPNAEHFARIVQNELNTLQ
ncbi:MAG: hypothetical protein EBZ77_16335 [Chitinophagia bacterium]|nr:hypothetical protein [Chitinophagia bacterium]